MVLNSAAVVEAVRGKKGARKGAHGDAERGGGGEPKGGWLEERGDRSCACVGKHERVI